MRNDNLKYSKYFKFRRCWSSKKFAYPSSNFRTYFAANFLVTNNKTFPTD